MKFVKVEEVPRFKNTHKGEMYDRLREFMKMNIKIVKVEDHHYKTAAGAYKSFYAAAKRWAFPIDVSIRSGEVYLIRRDI